MGYKLVFGTNSQAGTGIEYNSDAAIDFPIMDGHVFVVSDGHSGDEGHGALAAKMCVESIKKYFLNKSYKHIEKALTNSIVYANYTIYEQAQKDSKYRGMGATAAVLICSQYKVYYAYAGNSRIYEFKNGVLKALTKDHVSSENNEVYCLVGKQKDIKFGVSKNPLDFEHGMRYLLCTDGLFNTLSENEVKDIISDEDMAPEHKVINIADLAKTKGASDNVTLTIVARAIEAEEKKTPKAKTKKTIFTMILVIVASVFLGFGAFKGYQILADVDVKVIKTPKVKESTIIANKEVTEPVSVVINEPEPEFNKGSETVNIAEDIKAVSQAKNEVPTLKNTNSGNTIYQHKVLAGQNLYRLGLWYNISQDKIIEINGDKAKKMLAGSVMEIPVTAIYEVKLSDNLSSISKKFGVDQSKIIRANAKDKEWSLVAGREIVIPLP